MIGLNPTYLHPNSLGPGLVHHGPCRAKPLHPKMCEEGMSITFLSFFFFFLLKEITLNQRKHKKMIAS